MTVRTFTSPSPEFASARLDTLMTIDILVTPPTSHATMMTHTLSFPIVDSISNKHKNYEPEAKANRCAVGFIEVHEILSSHYVILMWSIVNKYTSAGNTIIHCENHS
jgi:hypothetical protein